MVFGGNVAKSVVVLVGTRLDSNRQTPQKLEHGIDHDCQNELLFARA